MITVGIVIDRWKLSMFERHFKGAGYVWEKHEGPIDETWLLTVITDTVANLALVTKAANDECAQA